SGSISTFQLGGAWDTDLYSSHAITVPFGKGDPGHRMRVSTHICNGFDQIDRLVTALRSTRSAA
ncbi:MAG: hypothetical protein QF395_04045, partial [Arenicellales bacterium]|nr:hypothetical protein [Arenicellales bacterium]